MTSLIRKRPRDPLAPTSYQDIWRTANRVGGMYGAPATDAQIGARAQGQLDPQVDVISQRARDAVSSIAGHSDALAKALASVDYGAPYAGAKQEQAAVDSALREGLAGGGAQLAGDLRSRLAQIDDPTVGAAAAQVAAQGTAAGNTELARGSANLGALIASGAAAKSYGQKLPGIARLGGLQDIGGVQRQSVNDIANVEAQLPSLVQALRSDRSQLLGNRASAVAQLYATLTGQEITKGTARAGLLGDQATLDANAAYHAAQLQAEADRQAAAAAAAAARQQAANAAALRRQREAEAAALRRQREQAAATARRQREHDARTAAKKNLPPWKR